GRVAALARRARSLHRHPRNVGRRFGRIFPTAHGLAPGTEPRPPLRLVSFPIGAGSMKWIMALLAAGAATPAVAQVPWNPRAPENNQVRSSFNYGTVEEV